MMGMIGVLGKPALARQDAVLGVARTQRFGARWLKSKNPDGSNPFVPDLDGYTGQFIIASDEGDIWLDKSVQVDQLSGLFSVVIATSDTGGAMWAARSTGRWSIVAKSANNEVTVLVTGIMRIVHGGAT